MSRFLLAPIALAAACAAPDAGPVPCNGDLALCDRPLDEVALPATHNAMSNLDEGWPAANQRHPTATQLADGVRGFLIDTYEIDDELLLCHLVCDFASRPLADFLVELDAFLDANPGEVVTLIVEDYVDPERMAEAFTAAGLDRRAIVPPGPGEAWPTLGELVATDRRVLATHEFEWPGDEVAWYPRFWDLGFDTPFTFSKIEDFSCELKRGSSDNDLFLINHWIGNPLSNPEIAAVANADAVLGKRVADCTAAFGRPPNLVAVDHYDVGDLFAVVRRVNGLDPVE